MRRSKEARKYDYDLDGLDLTQKIEGPTWGTFLANLDDAGFAFNDVYYEMPHKFIDAFRGDKAYQIKVKVYNNIGYSTYEVDSITEAPLHESCEEDTDTDEEEVEVLEEAERFTHKIVILPKDAGVNFTSAAQKRLRFKSQEEAEDYMNQLLSGGNFANKLKKRGLSLGVEEIPKKPRRTGTNDPDYENPFEVGDILFGDVGYSMQIPEWWQVIKKTAKSVTCRRLAADVVEHDGYGQSGRMSPVRGVFDKRGGTVNGVPSDAPQTMRVKKWSTTWSRGSDPKNQYYASLGGSRYGNIFSLWDGKPKPFDYYD